MTFLVWPCHFLEFFWILVYLAIEMFVTDQFQVIGSVPLNSLLTIVILSLNIAICSFFAMFPTVYAIPIIPDTATWVTWVTWAGATGREISWKSLRKSVNVWPSFTGEERDILAFLASQWFDDRPKPWRILTVLLYMVCHGSHQYTPFMLAYIPAPWILWGMEVLPSFDVNSALNSRSANLQLLKYHFRDLLWICWNYIIFVDSKWYIFRCHFPFFTFASATLEAVWRKAAQWCWNPEHPLWRGWPKPLTIPFGLAREISEVQL